MWRTYFHGTRETNYEVSSHGKGVRRKSSKKSLTPSKNDNIVSMYVDRRPVRRSLGSLVLETFVGPDPTGASRVWYKDGNPWNTKLENLEWRSVAFADQGQGARYLHVRLTPEEMRQLADLVPEGGRAEDVASKVLVVGLEKIRGDMARATELAAQLATAAPSDGAEPEEEAEPFDPTNWPTVPTDWPRFLHGPETYSQGLKVPPIRSYGKLTAWGTMWRALWDAMLWARDAHERQASDPKAVTERAYLVLDTEMGKAAKHGGGKATERYSMAIHHLNLMVKEAWPTTPKTGPQPEPDRPVSPFS